MSISEWPNANNITSISYKCGFCGLPLASEKGWAALDASRNVAALICICHRCLKPTFLDEGKKQYPGIAFGGDVEGIPDSSLTALYNEARAAMSVGSYTAVVLCCRKLLMHIAVQKNAAAGLNFIAYVEHLSSNHYIPPDALVWVDHIRQKSNEANHEILIMTKEDAEELITFCEMLLKVIYEFPAIARQKAGALKPAP